MVRLDLNHSGKDIGNGHAIALPPSAEIWLVPRNRSIPEASSRARPLDQVALARAPISRSGVVGIGSFSRENRASRCADCRAFYANMSSNIRVWRACTAIRDPDFSRDGRSFRVYLRHLARAFLRASRCRRISSEAELDCPDVSQTRDEGVLRSSGSQRDAFQADNILAHVYLKDQSVDVHLRGLISALRDYS